jgi:hypothetical protein
VSGRDLFGKKFGQLAKLDKCRGRIVKKVTLGERAQACKPFVLRGKKVEVAGYPHQSKSYQFTLQTQTVESAGPRYFSFITIPAAPRPFLKLFPARPLLMSYYFRFSVEAHLVERA